MLQQHTQGWDCDITRKSNALVTGECLHASPESSSDAIRILLSDYLAQERRANLEWKEIGDDGGAFSRYQRC